MLVGNAYVRLHEPMIEHSESYVAGRCWDQSKPMNACERCERLSGPYIAVTGNEEIRSHVRRKPLEAYLECPDVFQKIAVQALAEYSVGPRENRRAL